jgi:hypothetical protein
MNYSTCSAWPTDCVVAGLQVQKHTPLPFEIMNGIVVELPDGSSALAVRRMDSCSDAESALQKSPQLKSVTRLSDPDEASEGSSARICAPQGAYNGSSHESITAWESNPVYDGTGASQIDMHATEVATSGEAQSGKQAGSSAQHRSAWHTRYR